MCLIVFAYKRHPHYQLVLAANRDEFYRRPSAQMNYWKDCDILAGRDLEKMGTWMGITLKGRFAAVTNYRDPRLIKNNARSRGQLVSRFLYSNISCLNYLEELKDEDYDYNGFNLLLGDRNGLYYYSNVMRKIIEIKPGIYGLSNSFLDVPWPKVDKAKKALEKSLQGKEKVDIEELFRFMSDKERFADILLPQTGVSIEWERMLSSVFVEGKNYGTRTTTVLQLDSINCVKMIERTHEIESRKADDKYYQFFITQ